MDNQQRVPSEMLYRQELHALKKNDSGKKPDGWSLSPNAVYTFITGGYAGSEKISPKFIGDGQIVEIAIATLMTGKALLLTGQPGTAKSWLSEHLAAAVCMDSTLIVQGSLGITEDQIKYGWNYALLIAEGPSDRALVKTPLYRAMESGKIVRVEELTRCAVEVADSLISVLSEKSISLPELGSHLRAPRGFGLIATANTHDKGTNELSSALKRRFNILTLAPPPTVESELEIVRLRVTQSCFDLPVPKDEVFERVVTVFRELRQGLTLDGRQNLTRPSASASTAQAIDLLNSSMSLAYAFGNGEVEEKQLAGAFFALMNEELDVWKEYCQKVLKNRDPKLFDACAAFLP